MGSHKLYIVMGNMHKFYCVMGSNKFYFVMGSYVLLRYDKHQHAFCSQISTIHAFCSELLYIFEI